MSFTPYESFAASDSRSLTRTISERVASVTTDTQASHSFWDEAQSVVSFGQQLFGQQLSAERRTDRDAKSRSIKHL
jgi:hypothetical protein